MSRTAVALSSAPLVEGAATPRSVSCPFGAQCSCVFARVRPEPSAVVITSAPAGDPAFDAEVAKWVDSGWQVTRASSDDVSLERPLGLGFCVNAALCVLTAFVWLAYWIPSSRHPRIDTRRVTRSSDGTVSVARSVARR